VYFLSYGIIYLHPFFTWFLQTPTLLQKLSTPWEYSVLDNGCTHQIALKNNSVCQGVLMGVSGWKSFRGD
jgi:hypothetical protein